MVRFGIASGTLDTTAKSAFGGIGMTVRSNFLLTGVLGGAVAIAAATGVWVGAATAQQISLEGAWRGGGSFSLVSGKSEKARCQASFSKSGGSSFSMTATCATTDVRVTQTASLDRTGPNRFVGDFFNSDFGVSGTIKITVNGNTLTASLSGDKGSAIMSLSR